MTWERMILLSSPKNQARKHVLEKKTFFPSRQESLEGAIECITLLELLEGRW